VSNPVGKGLRLRHDPGDSADEVATVGDLWSSGAPSPWPTRRTLI
jgi:hypothetical protein